jgi:hypothetical protein
VTLAVTVPGRSGAILLVNSITRRRDTVSAITATTADPAAHIPTIQDREVADQADRGQERRRTWVWTLVEALAYAGAAFDPAAALAARRLAVIRDEELRRPTGIS